MNIISQTLSAIYERDPLGFYENSWWETSVRLDNGHVVELSKANPQVVIPNPTPEQERLRNRTRVVPLDQIGNYPPPPTSGEISRSAIREGPRRIVISNIDPPPLHHRVLGDATFEDSATLPENWVHYQTLTLGRAVEEGEDPHAATIETPLGGGVVIVQGLLDVHPGAVLSTDGKGAPGGQPGGWPEQPREDHPSESKAQEIIHLLRQIDFRYLNHGRNSLPIGGGGGGNAKELGYIGFTYCGRGGAGVGVGRGDDGNPAAGGAPLFVFAREIRNRGLLSARGLTVPANDRGGCGGGGCIFVFYEEGDPGSADARGGRYPDREQFHRDGLDGDVHLVKLPESLGVFH